MCTWVALCVFERENTSIKKSLLQYIWCWLKSLKTGITENFPQTGCFANIQSVGKFGSFVGQVEHGPTIITDNTDQLLLSTRTNNNIPIQVSVKMSEFRDNIFISENSLFYQHASVGKFGSFVGQGETSGNSASLQGTHFGYNTSCCKRWF